MLMRYLKPTAGATTGGGRKENASEWYFTEPLSLEKFNTASENSTNKKKKKKNCFSVITFCPSESCTGTAFKSSDTSSFTNRTNDPSVIYRGMAQMNTYLITSRYLISSINTHCHLINDKS